MNRNTAIDVTETANRDKTTMIRADRKGRAALVLYKVTQPIKKFDGTLCAYRLEDIILSQEEDNELACVYANDFHPLNKADMKGVLKALEGGKTLFDCFSTL